MNGYKPGIMDACGCSADEVAVVEGIMREDNGGVLDSLTERQFDGAARRAYREAQVLLADEQHAEDVEYLRKKGL